MRTTLDIDEDVLFAAKELARKRGQTTGKVISDLVRETLGRPAGGETRNGVPLFPVCNPGVVVTMDLVNELRDEAP